MKEVYRKIEGYEAYQISNYGNIRSESKFQKFTNESGYITFVLGGKMFNAHRLVAEHFIPKEEGKDLVDHIDNDYTNNFVDNLRWYTKRQNCQNLKKNKEGVTASKYVGVSFSKKGRKNWRAQIRIEGKNKELGTFLTQEEAAKAYDKKLIELGEQPANYPISEYHF